MVEVAAGMVVVVVVVVPVTVYTEYLNEGKKGHQSYNDQQNDIQVPFLFSLNAKRRVQSDW